MKWRATLIFDDETRVIDGEDFSLDDLIDKLAPPTKISRKDILATPGMGKVNTEYIVVLLRDHGIVVVDN